MPYNVNAIPPRKENTGSTALPLARVKRIIQVDEDIAQCSNNAAFVITIAAEMFIQYLAEQGYNVVKSERKPRRNIQYRDLANAVARIDNLEFLSDVIPRTIPYKQVKEKKAKETGDAEASLTDVSGDGTHPAAVNGSAGTLEKYMGARDSVQTNGSKEFATTPDIGVEPMRNGAGQGVMMHNHEGYGAEDTIMT